MAPFHFSSIYWRHLSVESNDLQLYHPMVSIRTNKPAEAASTFKHKFVTLANRTITHPRDKDGDYGIRVLLHIPIGLLMGIPVLGYQLMMLFFFYEKNEDKWTSDQTWKDTAGALFGMAITVIAILILIIWAAISFL